MAKTFHPIFEVIDGASADFDKVVEASEKKILSDTLGLIKGLDVDVKGNIKTTVSNLKKIGVIKARLTKIANNKQYLAGVAKLIAAFDKIYNEQKKYFDELSKGFVAHTNYHMGASSKFELMKTLAVENVANNLTGAGLSANVTGKISDMLLRAVTTGAKYSDIISEMHAYLVSTETSQGALSKYAKTYAVTALGQYTGQNNKLVTDDLGCEWFMYTGSTIETTREFCFHMTEKKYIHKSEFEQILAGKIDDHECAIYDKTGLPYGMIEGTTPENFQVNVGGWNCRHQLVPIAKEAVPADIRAKFEKPKQPTKEEIEAKKKAQEEAKKKAEQEQKLQHAIFYAQDILNKMKDMPAADKLKAAIKSGNVKQIEQETANLYQLQNQLLELIHIANVMEEAKTHTYEELKMVNDAVEAKMQQWSGLSKEQLIKKLKFEAIDFLGGNMKGVQDKYPDTWQLSQNAYLKHLEAIQKQVAIEGISQTLAPIKTWSDAHPKSKKVAKLLADAQLAINLGEDIAIIQQKVKLATIEHAKRLAEQAMRDKKKAQVIQYGEGDYSKESKDAALWHKSGNNKELTDAEFRDLTSSIWTSSSELAKDAAYSYTEGSAYLNEPLRGMRYIGRKSSINFKQHCNALTEMISRSKRSINYWVQRGEDWDAFGSRFNLDLYDYMAKPQDLVGKTGVELGFMSTGGTKGAGFSGSRVILNIYCPRGTQALYCEPFSHYGHGVHGKRGQNYGDGRNWDGVQKQSIYGGEFEILLQRGTEFKITKAEYNSKSKRWYIDLDIISQSYTPIT